MHHITAAALAFALGASARPQFPGGFSGFPDGGFSFPSFPAPSQPVGFPPGDSGSAAPIGTGIPSAPVGSVPAPAPSASAPVAPSVGSSFVFANSSAIPSAVGTGAASSAGPAATSAAVIGAAADSGGSLPASSGTSVLDAVQTVAAGESFDCGMVQYDRGVSCSEGEGGDEDAVFQLEAGASLSNCIIGPNQIEGVHCLGGCSIENVWWAAVCEDAFSIKEQDAGSTTTVSGGGAFGAGDKVLQHNGAGTLSVSGFTVDTFGKVYRSCGNCDEMYERHVIMDDITATGGYQIVGINSNYGDTATLSNIRVSDVDEICATYTGNDSGDEPEQNGSGPSESCIYEESDVTEI